MRELSWLCGNEAFGNFVFSPTAQHSTHHPPQHQLDTNTKQPHPHYTSSIQLGLKRDTNTHTFGHKSTFLTQIVLYTLPHSAEFPNLSLFFLSILLSLRFSSFVSVAMHEDDSSEMASLQGRFDQIPLEERNGGQQPQRREERRMKDSQLDNHSILTRLDFIRSHVMFLSRLRSVESI